MKRANFILCIEAYLLRKGVAAVLQRIPGAFVVREFGTVDLLTHYMKNHAVDFLLICDTLFEKATDLFIEDPGLLERTILLKINPVRPEKAGKLKEIIYLTDGKQEITFKINELLNPYFRNHRDEPHSTLTERERTIVRFVSMGLTNKQIADKLFLSTHTIITHRKNIIHKLGIKSVSGLTVYAIVNNIITIDEVT